MKRIATFAAALAVSATAALPAHAQSTEEVLGAAIGGSLGAVIGKEIDNKGSTQEGEILGAIIGGTVGYAIGEQIDHKNDRNRYYGDRRYRTNYPVYRDNRYAQPSYYPRYEPRYDGYGYGYSRKKAHPVFVEHPGRGRGHGLYKQKRRY